VFRPLQDHHQGGIYRAKTTATYFVKDVHVRRVKTHIVY